MPYVKRLRRESAFEIMELNMTQADHDSPIDLEDLLQGGFRYALSLTHNESYAEDIVQDACLNMVKGKKEWNKRLFFTIIRNRFIDLYRHSKKLDIYSVDGRQQRTADWSVKPNTETSLANAEILDSVMGKINHDQREALYLSVVEGYTAKEISQLTQTTRNTVLSHIHRARHKLAALLKKAEKRTKGEP